MLDTEENIDKWYNMWMNMNDLVAFIHGTILIFRVSKNSMANV